MCWTRTVDGEGGGGRARTEPNQAPFDLSLISLLTRGRGRDVISSRLLGTAPDLFGHRSEPN